MEPIDPALPVEGISEPPKLICAKCEQEIGEADRFCKYCGALRAEMPEAYSEEGFVSDVKPVIAFYVLILGLCIAASNIDAFSDYDYMVWIELVLAVLTLAFAASRWRDILPLYSFKNVKILPLTGYMAMAVGMSLLVNVSVTYINAAFFDEDYTYIIPYLKYQHTAVVFIASLAVYPAIFEELGFRGYVFNSVRDIAGVNSAIAISSMSFAIIHQSLISLFWLIPFAFWVGYLRNKHDTLWYGMAAHFAFNCTVCVLEMHEYGVAPFG